MIGRIAGQGGGGSFVKSVQSGSYRLSSTNHSIAINAVDLDNSIVIIQNTLTNSTSSDADENRIRAKLSNSTTINLYRLGSSYTVDLFYHVLEFEPSAIKSLQKIESTSSTSGSWNVNEVDLSKTVVFGSHASTNAYDEIYYHVGGYKMYNSTTVQFQSQASATKYHYIYIVEFN